MAGRLRAVSADHGLSLGDSFCLALAQRDGLPAWASDQSWKAVADAVKTKVVVIR
jgi:PIN domain nuclease of toxin-antitoxin system